MFVQMYSLLFGFESAVNQFSRWSKFLEAAGRVVLGTLWSMYVDDGNIVDFKAAKGSGQSSIHTLFDCLGSPLDLAKRELMSDKCVFLGVVHDMTKFHIDRTITFWPRERLLNKLRLYLVRIRESGKCTPAEAAKLRGTAQFMAHASAGGVGKFGLAPFKQRQYYDQAPWEAIFTMKLAKEYMNKLLADWPSRQIAVGVLRVPRGYRIP